jgi:hypothetical protein
LSFSLNVADGRIPGFNVVSWYGFFVTLKTPTEIITRMNNDIIAAARRSAKTLGAARL